MFEIITSVIGCRKNCGRRIADLIERGRRLNAAADGWSIGCIPKMRFHPFTGHGKDLKDRSVLKRKRPEHVNRHKVIFLDDNGPPCRAKSARESVVLLNWEPYPIPQIHRTWPLPIITRSHQWVRALSEQHSNSYEAVENRLNDCFVVQGTGFFTDASENCPRETTRWWLFWMKYLLPFFKNKRICFFAKIFAFLK